MNMVVPASFLAVAGLVVVHLFSGKLRFLGGTPRSVWLSVGGGVSVAYVFVHLLPELAESQETIAGAVGEELAFLEYHVYLVSLLGLVFFYGLEQTARGSRGRKAGRGDSTGQGIFWLHISSFAVYNAIIGYLLLHRLDSGLENLLLFSVAMALHFVVNDYGLRAHHTGAYARVGRWVISAAIVLGWVIGLLAEVPEAAIAALTAFLAGARS